VTIPEVGSPQGGVISPLLANVYLHYVLDVWFEQEVKPRLRGSGFLVRYADDFVMGFVCEEDARRVLEVLPKRFYDVLEVAKGRCNGHLLRRSKELRDTVPTQEQLQVAALSTLLKEAIDLASRRDELTPAGYGRRVQEVENRLDDWLAANLRQPTLSPELNRLDDHVRAHRGEWFVFLHDAEVPPTNNHAEQMLRPAVITRKVGGCNKTLWGALVHSTLASVMVTCKRQGQRFLDLARTMLPAMITVLFHA
jgi:hypothetical protein